MPYPTPNNRGAADRWIQTRLHNWLHNDPTYVPDFEYLHHHHATERDEGLFVLEDWAWLWHTHEQLLDMPHKHEGWGWSQHRHGFSTREDHRTLPATQARVSGRSQEGSVCAITEDSVCSNTRFPWLRARSPHV